MTKSKRKTKDQHNEMRTEHQTEHQKEYKEADQHEINDIYDESQPAEAAEPIVEDEVKLDFPYAGLVRAYAPKAMDVADKVASDWKKDGSFMNLGIENAYANMALSLGLKKAKELEKKLDEKGVLSAVRMGVEVIKQQVNKKK